MTHEYVGTRSLSLSLSLPYIVNIILGLWLTLKFLIPLGVSSKQHNTSFLLPLFVSNIKFSTKTLSDKAFINLLRLRQRILELTFIA